MIANKNKCGSVFYENNLEKIKNDFCNEYGYDYFNNQIDAKKCKVSFNKNKYNKNHILNK